MGRDAALACWGILLVVSVWLPAAVAHADSDGYFCIGPGYVAYLSQGLTLPTVASSPTLWVVAVGADGIRPAAGVAVPQVAVDRLACEAGRVVLDGGRVVELGTEGPRNAGVVQVRDAAPAAGNLTLWARPGAFEIPSPAAGRQFFLVVGVTELSRVVDGHGPILRFVASRVVELSTLGEQKNSVTVFEGVGVETVD